MGKKILILYGSQSGSAQDVAERVWRESRVLGFTGSVMCMDSYPIEHLISEPLVIFVCSTTGQGEEPDNMKNFWKFLLRKNLPTNSLQNMKYSVLGLGDSSYAKFNYAAKRLNRRLSDLGGDRIINVGLADDQHDLGADAVVDVWINNLWETLSNIYQFSFKNDTLKCATPLPRYSVEIIESPKVNSSQRELPQIKKFTEWHPCKLVLKENKRTTHNEHFQDVRLLKFHIPDDFHYQPGDVLMMSPRNSKDRVEQFFKVLNENRTIDFIRPNENVKLVANDPDMPVPRMLTAVVNLQDCATAYWDLNAVPRRYTFRLLSHITDNELEKEKLLEFSQAEGQEDLYNYCNRPKRNIVEVLQDFPCATKNMNLDYLFDVMQPIKARAFSVASSPSAHKNELHILVAVIVYKTKLVTPRIGLCSTYLADLKEGAHVYGWPKEGSFKFPLPNTPCVMIGPGTGIAPFRSYVSEMCAVGQGRKDMLKVFFGCRHQEGDFHFKDEWMKYEQDGFVELFSAFSRDQPHKIYVQHKLMEQGELVWKLLKENGVVMIAGSSKNMPQQVRETFLNISSKFGGLSLAEAEKFIERLEFNGRYQTETWG